MLAHAATGAKAPGAVLHLQYIYQELANEFATVVMQVRAGLSVLMDLKLLGAGR